MNETFNHEKLIVYRRSVGICTRLCDLSSQWDGRHDIRGHLPRAAESIVMNLAEACAAHEGSKHAFLDYSHGSTLECAASLDIASIKGLCEDAEAHALKKELSEICRMLIGLGKSWERSCVKEDTPPYDHPHPQNPLFNHETLKVYQQALETIRWGCSPEIITRLSAADATKLDELCTTIVLNVAEGNGRFSCLDHRRFLNIAHHSAIKLAAKLDLLVARAVITDGDAAVIKEHLVPVSRMLNTMMKNLKDKT